MRINVIVCLSLIALFPLREVDAQMKKQLAKLSNPEARGDHANSSFNYDEAAGFYLKAIALDNTNQGLQLKLADCYRKESNFREAVKWYKPVLESPEIEVPNIYKLWYGQSLMAVNRIEEAKKWFHEHHKSDTLALTENRLEGLEHYTQFFESKESVHVKALEINSKERDYSPVFYQRGILFVSERPHKFLFKKKKDQSSSSKSLYSNLYYSTKRAEGYFDEPEILGSAINTDLHEGPLCVYNNEKKLAFTRNNFLKRQQSHNAKGISTLQIYFAKKNKHGDWAQIGSFEYNNNNYSSAHPAINNEGTQLIFSSNMPGGYGGADLYYCKIQSDSSWSKPVNLGASINTEGNEYFPNMSGEKLYFSSNGHPGIGGLDIYQTTFNDGIIGPINNLGVPINSHADDFSYIEDETGNNGYFSSNRNSPLNDDIFEFSKVPVSLTIDLTDARSQEKLSEATVSVGLSNADNKTWNYRGNKVRITSVLNVEHVVNIQAPGYFDLTASIQTGADNPTNTREFIFPMKREPDLINDSIQLIINGQQMFMAFDKNVYTPHYGDDVVITDGIHNIKLGFPLSQAEHMKLPSTLIRNGYKIKKPLVVDNIYYATNTHELRKQDKVVLREFIYVMEEFDELNLFINSHADSRGSKKHNLALSEKRAKAARTFLVDNGIKEKRLNILFFGEHVPENDCIDGVNCNEADYQQNRKSEFGFYVRKVRE